MIAQQPCEENIVSAPIQHGELWAAFAGGGQEAREQLIQHFTSFARMLAAKAYARRQINELEFADFLQFALIGLVEAIDRFDISRNVRFEAFAAVRITGAILSGIEKSTDRQEQISLRARMRRQRQASLTETQEQVEVTPLFEKLAEVAIGLAVGYMLEDSGMYQQPEEPSKAATAYERTEFKQLCEIMHRLVEFLPDQEKKVVKYHYFHGHTFERIAELIKLTAGRISQLHKQGVQGLRKLFRKYGTLNDKL